VGGGGCVFVGGKVGKVVAVNVVVGLLVFVGVGLDATVVSVGCAVSVGGRVKVGALEVNGVVVGRSVSVGAGRANLTPPSESASRKPPITIAQEKKAATMPIKIPVINRPWL
jgi:hypothetical protein